MDWAFWVLLSGILFVGLRIWIEVEAALKVLKDIHSEICGLDSRLIELIHKDDPPDFES